MTIETPCLNLCQIDPTRAICAGCGRTLDEIATWAGYPAAERRRIMAELPARLANQEHDARA